jgi:hypothetical protein
MTNYASAVPYNIERPVAKLPGKKTNYGLWTVQVILALLFLFTGSMKLILPIEALTKQMALPGLLLRFIGVAEVAGALGLILPGLLRIRTELTPLAAAGLATIVACATILTIVVGGGAAALIPFVTGLLAAFVAYGRAGSLSGKSL